MDVLINTLVMTVIFVVVIPLAIYLFLLCVAPKKTRKDKLILLVFTAAITLLLLYGEAIGRAEAMLFYSYLFVYLGSTLQNREHPPPLYRIVLAVIATYLIINAY